MKANHFCKKSLSLRKFSMQILWLLLLVPALGYAANLANNPSMEGPFISQPPLGNVAEHWTGWTEAGGVPAGFWQGNVAHDAYKSQEIQWGGMGSEDFGDDGIYQQISSPHSGQIYRVSMWFRFSFNAAVSWGWAGGSIICRVGVDPNGGTDPNVVTNWADAQDSTDTDWYEGDWINLVVFSPANASTATVFIEAYGSGDAWEEGGGEGEGGGEWPATWDAYCDIDDVNFQLIQISSDNSTVTAATPVPANGASYSTVTITVLDPNSNPIEGIPASQISVNCTGSGNLIFGPGAPTDANGRTTARIVSTAAGSKTVSAAVFGTVLSDTPIVQFCKSGSLSKLRASDGAAYDSFGTSVSISGNHAIIGAVGDDDNGSYSGSAYIFTPNSVDPNNWEQQAKLTASDAAADDRFGTSVSISGNYAIAGAHGDDDNGSYSGSAYIFTPNSLDPNNWEQLAKLTAFDGAAYDHFGQSVSISGNYAIVGAYANGYKGSFSGSAYIFTPNEVDPGNWNQQQTRLLAFDGVAYDEFGTSVSISGDYAIVGAPYDNDKGDRSGSAYVFRRNGQNYWVYQNKLTASDGVADDLFGQSVSISGDYAIVGARSDEGNGSYSGSAYIFHFNGSNWVQQQKLTASDAAGWDDFGWSVSINSDYAVVGAYGKDYNRGSTYIFRRNHVSGNWTERVRLTAPDGAAGDSFGTSVSISGNYTIIGGGDDDRGFGSGAAYVFNLSAVLGDFDGDGDVDMVDFSILAGQWLQVPAQPSADAAPCGGDCVVDIWDMAVLCENWLQGTE